MATKNKHRSKRAAGGLLQQARRWLVKGNFKQALKDAKVCYRQQPDLETRQLLEQAYLARGRELLRAGLRVECRAVVEGLLELGVTDPTVRDGMPQLLIALGLFDRVAAAVGPSVSPEQEGALLAKAADHAVVRPNEVPASLPGIRQGAAAVRRALAALEADRESEALAALKDIPRSSPVADWKYFVRGLAAYYRQDAAEMQANWERLDAERFAARIAAPLRHLAGAATIPADDHRTADLLSRLGKEVLGGPVLTCLEKLQGQLARGRWREAVNVLRGAAPLLGQVDAALPQQVAVVVYETLVRKGVPSVLGELARFAAPPPMDPHWNRGLAMAWELSDDDHSGEDPVEMAERYWRAYLKDLAGLQCLSPAEQKLARALVWLRLGRMLVVESGSLCTTCGVRHDPNEQEQTRAVECLRNSLKLAPDLRPAYQALADAFEEWEEPQKAAATYRRLIERSPEDLEALLYLADHYAAHDESHVAREFVLRAQRLKPLDRRIKAKVWTVHLESARHHALAGRWDEGRAEFAAAEKLDAGEPEPHHLLVQQAALEFKAGQFGLANRLLDRARAELGEEAPACLLMTIQGLRYALPKLITDEFEHRWQVALKRRPNSRAAGQMCRILSPYLANGARYPRWKSHVQRLLAFLRRCSRAKWQPQDLRDVLRFLIPWEHEESSERRDHQPAQASPSGAELLAEFVAKARAAFPENAYFQFMAGEMEFRKGPRSCDRRLARDCFQRALELAAGASDPDSIDVAKRVKEKLHLLDVVEKLPWDDGPNDDEDERPNDQLDSGEDDEDDDSEGSASPTLPGTLFNQFMQICRTLGLDPREVLDKAATKGLPFRLPGMEGEARPQRKR